MLLLILPRSKFLTLYSISIKRYNHISNIWLVFSPSFKLLESAPKSFLIPPAPIYRDQFLTPVGLKVSPIQLIVVETKQPFLLSWCSIGDGDQGCFKLKLSSWFQLCISFSNASAWTTFDVKVVLWLSRFQMNFDWVCISKIRFNLVLKGRFKKEPLNT